MKEEQLHQKTLVIQTTNYSSCVKERCSTHPQPHHDKRKASDKKVWHHAWLIHIGGDGELVLVLGSIFDNDMRVGEDSLASQVWFDDLCPQETSIWFYWVTGQPNKGYICRGNS